MTKRAKSPIQLADGASRPRCRASSSPARHVEIESAQGTQWLNEIKYDGYRVQLHTSGGSVAAYTRNGPNWTKRFGAITWAFDIPAKPSSTARQSS